MDAQGWAGIPFIREVSQALFFIRRALPYAESHKAVGLGITAKSVEDANNRNACVVFPRAGVSVVSLHPCVERFTR